MKKFLAFLVIALFMCAAVYGAVYFLERKTGFPGSQPAAVEAPYVMPKLTQDYKNDQFKFSLKMPADFKASVTPPDESGAQTIALQNTAGDGVQISVTPFDEDVHNLTEDRIHQDVPDLTITDPQPVEIGQGDQGLAFKSDNADFGGASREVWFVFNHNLYQISTYDRLDDLLKAIFATWNFTG